jgi:hypothetical protein
VLSCLALMSFRKCPSINKVLLQLLLLLLYSSRCCTQHTIQELGSSSRHECSPTVKYLKHVYYYTIIRSLVYTARCVVTILDAETDEDFRGALPKGLYDLIGSGEAVTAVPNLEQLRRIDEGIRDLGYPHWPLTASRQDVQQYLDDVEAIVQQMPSVAAEHADDTWVFGDLTDYYMG